MYKNTSRNNQGRMDRKVIKDVYSQMNAELPEDERREMIRGMLTALELQFLDLHPKDPKRRELGQRKWLLQQEMTLLKKKKTRVGLAQVFYDVARWVLPRAQWSYIEGEAVRVYDLRNKGNQEAIISPQLQAEFKKMFGVTREEYISEAETVVDKS